VPPLIAAMLVGAGAYAGLRAVHRILASWSEIEAGSHPDKGQAPTGIVEKDLGSLELDPATGIYHPAKPAR